MSADELKTHMLASRERLLRAIAGVTEEQFKRRPSPTPADPQPWSIAEVLAHLLATEHLWAQRIRLALDHDGAQVTPSDPADHDTQARAGRLAPVPQLVHGLLGSARDFDRLLEQATAESALDRSIEHVARGRLTVTSMLQEYAVQHELEHAVQIEATRLAVGAKPVEAGA